MKIRSIGNVLLLFGGFLLVWSGNPRQLCAGQNYPSHVSVFGQSSAPSTPTQQIDPAKRADIRKLMDLAAVKDNLVRIMKVMEASMRPLLLRTLPPGAYRERLVELFYERVHAKMTPDRILDMAVPVYAKYLSDDDVKGLIQFFETPLGRKWVSVMPKMQGELVPEIQAWARGIGRQSMQEVLEEHPDLKEQLKAAAESGHQHQARQTQ